MPDRRGRWDHEVDGRDEARVRDADLVRLPAVQAGDPAAVDHARVWDHAPAAGRARAVAAGSRSRPAALIVARSAGAGLPRPADPGRRDRDDACACGLPGARPAEPGSPAAAVALPAAAADPGRVAAAVDVRPDAAAHGAGSRASVLPRVSAVPRAVPGRPAADLRVAAAGLRGPPCGSCRSVVRTPGPSSPYTAGPARPVWSAVRRARNRGNASIPRDRSFCRSCRERFSVAAW